MSASIRLRTTQSVPLRLPPSAASIEPSRLARRTRLREYQTKENSISPINMRKSTGSSRANSTRACPASRRTGTRERIRVPSKRMCNGWDIVSEPNGAKGLSDTPRRHPLVGTYAPIAAVPRMAYVIWLTRGRHGGARPRQDLRDDGERVVDIRALDSVVRDRAQPRGVPQIARDAQAALRAGPDERGRVHPVGIDLEGDDVRRDPVGIDADAAESREADGEGLRVAVIVDEALAHLLERDQRGGGDDARLPHGAAEELADAASLRDCLGAAAEHRSDRRGKALREAE